MGSALADEVVVIDEGLTAFIQAHATEQAERLREELPWDRRIGHDNARFVAALGEFAVVRTPVRTCSTEADEQ